jgi:hypothetical protein
MKRKIGVLGIVGAALVLAALSGSGAGAQDRGGDCTLLSAGNDYYTIYTRDQGDNTARGECVVGAYGIVTGPEHPAGEGLAVFQDGSAPFTSFNTVRSYTTGTDYVLTNIAQQAGRGFSPLEVGNLSSAQIVDDNTLRVTFVLPGDKVTPDALTITIEIDVFGTTLEDSSVRVTTTVENDNAPAIGRGSTNSVDIGIRYLWDLAVDTFTGTDAGPQILPAFDFVPQDNEISDSSPPDFYDVRENESGTSAYALSGTVNGPAALQPTDPTRFDFVCAQAAFFVPFDYTVAGHTITSLDVDCSENATGDSGVAYYWTEDENSAARGTDGITIPAGGSHSVNQSIYTYPLEQPELCLSLELDATQTNGNLGIPNLQNNDVVCGEDVLEEPNGSEFARGDEDPFELFFDGSDVGITRTIIDGMDILEPLPPTGDRGQDEQPADILFSFNQAHSLPPIGLVLQSDIVRFVASENGPQTGGSFERFFDGSDIGLQSGGENIDAFLFEEYGLGAARGNPGLGNLYFSTSGNLNIPGVTARDEDIVVCVGYDFTLLPTGDIDSTCQDILRFFDGSEAGLANANEDVDAFTFGIPLLRGVANQALYLSTYGNFNVNDENGRNEDVFACYVTIDPANRGGFPITSCDAVAIVFDGSDYGLGSNNVYSIDLLQPY